MALQISIPNKRFTGVLTPVITPFKTDLQPDSDLFVTHCRWLVSQQVGLAVFGTNSEGNSLSVKEKQGLLDELAEGNIDPNVLMPGTGCCSIGDTVELTKHAVSNGCAGVLMLPPFYYKNVSDDGLFAYFSEVIQRVGSDALNIYLYNIPPVAHVGLSVELIERLLLAYPNSIVGIKDSSGDWSNTERMISQQWEDFQIFVGSESFLLQNMRAGGAGCISATANVNPSHIHALYSNWNSDNAEAQQTSLNSVRSVFSGFDMIPALKAATALYSENNDWLKVRPPLTGLTEAQRESLSTQLSSIGFTMPGLKGL